MHLFSRNITLNCAGRLFVVDEPKVMGILNLTPDSFFDGGKYLEEDAYLSQVEKMISEGADMVDIGGMSSRPGAAIISREEELARVIVPIQKIHDRFPEIILSIDTVHAKVAKAAVQAGALIVNDISAGSIDPKMLKTVAKLDVPYVIMHMKGKPGNMQDAPNYSNVSLEVLDFFIEKVKECHAAGITNLILDPGFGFGKTVAHNYTLLRQLRDFDMLELPVLVGLSRKSMISRALEVDKHTTLNGTTALHMIALERGANILRVHDVKEAKECVKLWKQIYADTQ